jgi:hypothetical protein
MPKNNVTDLITEQDTQEQRRFNVGRDKVLARLWDIANMDPERTRNSMSAQVKAISMIVAIEGLIPDRKTSRAVAAQNQPAPPPTQPPFYVSACARTQQPAEPVHPSRPRPLNQKKRSRRVPTPSNNPLPAGWMIHLLPGLTQFLTLAPPLPPPWTPRKPRHRPFPGPLGFPTPGSLSP